MMIGGGIRGPRAHRGKRNLNRPPRPGLDLGGDGTSGKFNVKPVNLTNVVICHTSRITSFHMTKDDRREAGEAKEAAPKEPNGDTPPKSSLTVLCFDGIRDSTQPSSKPFSSKRLTRIVVYLLAQCLPCCRKTILSYSFDEEDYEALPRCEIFKSYSDVTSTCLWHACRAITLGVILIIAGITMAVLGYISDQNSYSPDSGGRGGAEKFKLNNLSFAGPVTMGFGGFLIVAACVMTFEARDNASKIGPSSSEKLNGLNQTIPPVVNFKSSSSQTTFLDRNIVQTLNAPSINIGSPSSSGHRLAKNSPLPSSTNNTNSSQDPPQGQSTNVSLAVKRNRFKGSVSHSGSGSTTKRASISGQLPLEDPSSMEPGLVLMDELGRQALTSVFLNFQKDTAQKLASYFQGGEILLDPLGVPSSLPKCPSAPDIQQDPIKSDQMSSSDDVSAQNSASKTGKNDPGTVKNASGSMSKASKCYPYKVLTPTMYRSCMAATRQAVSMDCEGTAETSAKIRREGPALRVPSPIIKHRCSPNESIDLELGASANSHCPKESKTYLPRKDSSEDEESGSMVLDLHLEGSGPVTLLVKDESRTSTVAQRDSVSPVVLRRKKTLPHRSSKSIEELADNLNFIDDDASSLSEEEVARINRFRTCKSLEWDDRKPVLGEASVKSKSFDHAVVITLASPEDITDEDEINGLSRKFSQRHFLVRQNKFDASPKK